MSSQGRSPSSPRRFKVPIPSTHAAPKRRKRDKRRRRNGNDPEEENNPDDARLLFSPQHKAATPYDPGSVREELYLRFLIHYCEFLTLSTSAVANGLA
jgi:hypothetical protein